jgi:hypothetical protein
MVVFATVSRILEERKTALLGGLHVVLDYARDDVSLVVTEIHGFGVSQPTSHVPGHLERLFSDLYHISIHSIH